MNEITYLPIDSLRPHPGNPRKALVDMPSSVGFMVLRHFGAASSEEDEV